jgi:hypothetical protein
MIALRKAQRPFQEMLLKSLFIVKTYAQHFCKETLLEK